MLLVAAVVQSAHYYPILADRLASHFDAGGTPNGWQSKQAFFGFYIGGVLVSAFIAFGIPRLIAVLPNQLVNLPNKEYWLAPQRREETSAYLDDFFAWFGSATLFIELSVFELSIRANLSATGRLAPVVWVLFGGYLLFVLVWVLRLVGHFARIPK